MQHIDARTPSFLNVLSLHRVDSETYQCYLNSETNWIYINTAENVCSTLRARVNCAGYLVIGNDMDTRIVCLENGHLAYSDNSKVSAVRFDDPNLFIFNDQRGDA